MNTQKVITYRELTTQIDEMILCNQMEKRLFDTLDLFSGEFLYCTFTEEEFEEDEDLQERYEDYNELVESCDYTEYYEIFQWFIIDEYSAKYLSDHTNEIIFYDNELDLFVLGVTHVGTSWKHVLVSVDNDFVVREWKL